MRVTPLVIGQRAMFLGQPLGVLDVLAKRFSLLTGLLDVSEGFAVPSQNGIEILVAVRHEPVRMWQHPVYFCQPLGILNVLAKRLIGFPTACDTAEGFGMLEQAFIKTPIAVIDKPPRAGQFPMFLSQPRGVREMFATGLEFVVLRDTSEGGRMRMYCHRETSVAVAYEPLLIR
jgi:hypothetical protein